nr:iron-containing alcohol dehydrogenase [Halalkalibacillus halophilus]
MPELLFQTLQLIWPMLLADLLELDFFVPHGLSVAMLLPFVLDFSTPSSKKRIREIAKILYPERKEHHPQDVVERVLDLNNQFATYDQGKAYFTDEELEKAIPQLTQDARSGNGILTNRQIPTEKDIHILYKKLLP